MTIKTKIIGLLSAALLLLMTACEEGKSYSDLLREEERAVNWYLAQNRVETRVPEDSVFEIGPDAPFYRMNADGTVYMRVIRTGDMNDRPEKGQTVYFRFMRQNIKFLYEKTNLSDGEGNADDMGSNLGGMHFVYGNNVLTSTTKYGTGIQVPLNYLGYNCEVDLIVKSIDGSAENVSDCIPFVYKSLKYFKAEY